MNNFSLTRAKLAVFDFDDTLAIHKNKDWTEDRGNDYYIQAHLNPDGFYETIEPCAPCKNLQRIVQFCRANDIPTYCLSGMRFSLHFKAKEAFINNHYGSDVKLLSCGTQALKADMLQMLEKIHNCNAGEILFVDDLSENIAQLSSLGYWAVNINDVGNIDIPNDNV